MEGDEMCVVCCGPPKAPTEDLLNWDEALRDESLDWLNHFVGITKDEDLIPLDVYLDFSNFAIQGEPKLCFGCATYFRTPEGIPWEESSDGPYGLACHEKCFRLLQQELQYTLRFRDVWPLLMQAGEFATNWVEYEVTDYGGMARYAGEAFNYTLLCSDGNTWMLRDPTTEKQNADRILKVWRGWLEEGFPVREAEVEDDRDGCVEPRVLGPP